VKTEQEKQLFSEIACRIAQPQNVDHEMEVKFAPNRRELIQPELLRRSHDDGKTIFVT